MRAALVAFALVGSVTVARATEPTVKQLLAAEAQATRTCQGSADPSRAAEECSRRDRLFGRLSQLGWCFGMKGQTQGQKEWHPCGPNSVRSNDLQPD
ncbi:hypothetical protein FV232_27055 [Methylobacterium sp. WL30]|nr:hypothetical protein FV225_05320 [Methylobacterium sp. WL93]TXN49990.1 hypothetical protein FV227_14005 [Methylobacterium sp. WL119]TXN61481.1 hypothetical protein FV232_27055 [Methylobacterium sp. WL30]